MDSCSSVAQLFSTLHDPITAACQASLSITNSRSLLKQSKKGECHVKYQIDMKYCLYLSINVSLNSVLETELVSGKDF